MKMFKPMLGMLLLATLAACASGPGYKEASSAFTPVQVGQGRVFVYRTAMMGAAVQPDVHLNGDVIGSAVPGGFFYVDRSPGDYQMTTTTELKKSLSFHLDAGQTRYVRLNIAMGLLVGHVYPELIDEAQGAREIQTTKFAAPKAAAKQ
jgi:hypothetical protein